MRPRELETLRRYDFVTDECECGKSLFNMELAAGVNERKSFAVVCFLFHWGGVVLPCEGGLILNSLFFNYTTVSISN